MTTSETREDLLLLIGLVHAEPNQHYCFKLVHLYVDGTELSTTQSKRREYIAGESDLFDCVAQPHVLPMNNPSTEPKLDPIFFFNSQVVVKERDKFHYSGQHHLNMLLVTF